MQVLDNLLKITYNKAESEVCLWNTMLPPFSITNQMLT